MPAIGAILGWFFALVGSVVTWLTTAVVGHVVATQVADTIMRFLRVAAVLATLTFLMNALCDTTSCVNSLYGLWDTYGAEAVPLLHQVGWLLPFGLFFSLLDLYLCALAVIFSIWCVKALVASSR